MFQLLICSKAQGGNWEHFNYQNFTGKRKISCLVCFCSGLTLDGFQVPTKAALSLPLLSWSGEIKYNERLVGQNKDRDITQQLPYRAKQNGLREN